MQPGERELFERERTIAHQTFVKLKELRNDIAIETAAGHPLQVGDLKNEFAVQIEILRSAYFEMELYRKGGADSALVERAVREVQAYFRELGEDVPAV